MDLTRLEAKLDRLDGKLDILDSRLDNVDKTLAVQAEQLGTHIKRTDIAEANLGILRNDMKPVHAHVLRMDGALKLIGLVAVLGSLAATIIKLFGE